MSCIIQLIECSSLLLAEDKPEYWDAIVLPDGDTTLLYF